jgi:hypothetical protein
MQVFARRGLRTTVSAVTLLSFALQPVIAQGRGSRDEALDACSAQRAPLVKLDHDYEQLKRSKLGAAIGEGLKTGATVIAAGVVGSGRSFGGFGGFGGVLGAVGGLAAHGGGQPAGAAPGGLVFGQDMLSGALGLHVPGVSSAGFGGGDSVKAYAALAVVVAIVATAEAYAQLKAQESGGDLKLASEKIDEDAGRQLTVANEIEDSGAALADCRSQQLADIDTRLASASNDRDRRAIKRERTEFIGALKKDIDLTGDVVEQHETMAKTFTQGRAMTDGTSEAAVLGGQKPAYADAADTTELKMPAAGQDDAPKMQQAAYSPPPDLVTLHAAPVRTAPVASAATMLTFPAGRHVTPKADKAVGGWWEIDVAGSPGYIRAADLGAPGGKAMASGKPAAAPAIAGPANIRAYNRTVIAARSTGKDRLSNLMTDIQTSLRKESVFYALLERIGLA